MEQRPTPQLTDDQRQTMRARGAAHRQTRPVQTPQENRNAKRARVKKGTDAPIASRARTLKAVRRGVEVNPEIEAHALQVLSGDEETTLINSGEYLPQSTPPLIFGDSSDPTVELRRNNIFQLWMRGYDTVTIAKKLGSGYVALRRDIKLIRAKLAAYIAENPQVFGGPIETLYLQIVRRRDRQSAIWEEINDAPTPAQKPAFYRLIAEEDTAIEKLLGMDRKTLAVTVGSPMEQAQADMLRAMGPTGLKELLEELRRVHPLVANGESIQTIDVTPTSAGQVLR